MTLIRILLFVLAFMSIGQTPAWSESPVPGKIHGYLPAETQMGDAGYNLPFEKPADGIARAEFRSEEFYAIILKSGSRCSFTDAERKVVQDQFQRNKVFMDFYQCDDASEELLRYSNVDPEYSFIAVFGGLNLEDAKRLFDTMDLKRKFPGANIRKMQAVLDYP